MATSSAAPSQRPAAGPGNAHRPPLPTWSRASPTSFRRRPQLEKTTALAPGSAARIAASSDSSADTWAQMQCRREGRIGVAIQSKRGPVPSSHPHPSQPRCFPTGNDTPPQGCTAHTTPRLHNLKTAPWHQSRRWRRRPRCAPPHSGAPPPRSPHQTGPALAALQAGGVRI